MSCIYFHIKMQYLHRGYYILYIYLYLYIYIYSIGLIYNRYQNYLENCGLMKFQTK